MFQEFVCERARAGQGEHIFEVSSSVKLVCSSASCSQSRFMHKDCFDQWEARLLAALGGTKRGRAWSDKQRAHNLWRPAGFGLVSAACGCSCGGGQLRKDLSWVAPRSPASTSGETLACSLAVAITPPLAGPSSDSEKQKRRRKKSSKNSKPALTIGLPTFVNGLQVTITRSQCLVSTADSVCADREAE